MSLVTSGKFSQALFDKNIKTWAATGAAQLAAEMPYFKKFAAVGYTTEEMFSMLDGVERGEFVQIAENGRIPEVDDLPGFKTTYITHDFGLIKSISHVAGRADASAHKQKQESNRMAALGKAYVRKMNNDVADVVKNGFSTAFTSYGDAKPFFSTSHTRIDGGATTFRSNASSTGLVLDYDNLKTLKRQHLRVVDGAGEVIDYSTKKIQVVVPKALEDAAYEAIGILPYAPGGAEFTPNRNANMEVVVWPLLGTESKGATGSDTAWFLHTADLGEEEPIKVYIREGLSLASEDDFDTRKMKTRGTSAWAIGWEDPVGKWTGSKGDGAAYAS